MNTRYAVRAVPKTDLDRAWPHVSAYLAGALSRNCRGYCLADVKEAVADDLAWLLLVTEGERIAAAVVIYADERASALCVWLMGGEGMSEWLPVLIDTLSRMARDMDLKAIQAEVRPGLARTLKDWRQQYITVRKDVWAE